MSLIQAVILGVVQGITEFFPVSSSGHLVIFQSLFGLKEPQLAFDIFVHLGTLISILIFFHKDIVELFAAISKSASESAPARATLIYLIVASIPTAIIGFLFKDCVEKLFGMPRVVGFMLLVTGAFLFLAAARSHKSGPNRQPGMLNSIIIGIAQGVAVIPGISRSGATIATGILTGLKGEEAFRFSFLLAIPAIAGASLVKAHKITTIVTSSEAFTFLAGGIAAVLTGLVALHALQKVIKANKLNFFGIYCIIAGILVIILIR